MKIHAVWTDDLPHQISSEDEADLEAFMELLDFIDDHDICMCLNEDSVYSEPEFCEWIYSREDARLTDIKKELMIKISKGCKCDEEKMQELSENIGRLLPVKHMGLNFREEMQFYAATIKKLYSISRIYLAQESINEFKEDMRFCFPYIYFDDTVEGSLNTLNRRFEDIREEILEHLTAINDYRNRFLYLSEEKKGYRDISAEFEKDRGVECSPQADRKQVERLKREVWNSDTGKMETVTCELHTKFKRHNKDITKQDRIYFAPARKGILDGRSIIVHIGDHL